MTDSRNIPYAQHRPFFARAIKPEEVTKPYTTIEESENVDKYRVMLFNDNEHTFEEVIQQLMIAISCSRSKAERLTWLVHTHGRSMVFIGSMEACLQVSAVLEEIVLRTEIQSME